MKNVLVTGGAGFIGSNFVRYLLGQRSDVNVYNLDALTYAGHEENLSDLPNRDKYTFVQGDICDVALVEGLFVEHAIDTVVHFAAESHVDRSIETPQIFVETNIQGTMVLLEAARKYWLEQKLVSLDNARFHHISTDEVYGSLAPEDPAFTETTPYTPNSPYSASKAASDHFVRAFAHTYGLPYTLTNCSNNYGPYQFPEKLIPVVILNALNHKPLPIYGDGQQVRDWLYVEDHCDAILTVLEQGVLGETYNVGGDTQVVNLVLVEQICDLLDELQPSEKLESYRELITFVTDRLGHDRRYAVDISKIREKLNWSPKHDLKDGLLKTIKWYLDNQAWLTAVSEK